MAASNFGFTFIIKSNAFRRSLSVFAGVLLFLFCTANTASASFQPFGSITVTPNSTLNGPGTNVDTIAFWDAPDPSQSLMFVTSKNVRLVEVWKYPFQTASDNLPSITHSCLNQNTNGVWVDQETDLLYVSMRSTGTVCVFSLPALSHVRTISTGATSDEPNITILNHSSGQKRLYVSSDSRVHVHDASTGAFIRQFTTNPVETVFADDLNQVIYIPDESTKKGVFIHNPDGGQIGQFGQGQFESDAEGVWMYTCPSSGAGDNGEGLIFVSDQKDPLTDFEVFNRKTKAHLGKMQIQGVNNTDGLALTQQSSSRYPKGIFAAIDDDTSAALVSMEKILTNASLSCPNESGPSPTPTRTPTPITNPTATRTPTRTPTPVSQCPGKPYGDANCNNVLDLGDLTIILASFGKSASADSRADIDGNGIINLADLTPLLAYYGKPVPGISSSPTPTWSAASCPVIASNIMYNADSSARIARPSGKVEVKGNPLNPQQGWMAVRVKMGFASNTSLSPDPIMWDMSETDPSDLFVYYDVDSDRFRVIRRKDTKGGFVYSPVQTFSSGTTMTIIAAWTSTAVKFSINGNAFVTASTEANTMPALAPLFIGSSIQQGSGRQPNSDYFWAAGGTGTLTDAQAGQIHGFGNTDKTLTSFPGNPAFIWDGELC